MFDISQLEECPTLRPTQTEFRDPIGYLSRPDIKNLGYHYGIVKVVPPTGWTPQFSLSSDFRFHTRLQKLSDLGIRSRSRKFFTENLNRFLTMRRRKPLELSFSVNSKTIWYYDLFVQVDNLGGYANLRWSDWQTINHHFGVHKDSIYLQNEYFVSIKAYAEFLNSNLSSTLPESDSEDELENCLLCGQNHSPDETLLCENCDNPYHIRCLGLEKVPSGTWYCKKCLVGTGEYGFEEEVDRKFSLGEFFEHSTNFQKQFFSEYGPMGLAEIEKKFWEFVEVQRSDIEVRYGADIHNLKPGQISGFPMKSTPPRIKAYFDEVEFDKYAGHPFNLTNLPYSKGSLLNYIKHSISGMTVPWIYVGSLLSTFCWHVEDHYTLSANYCHFGSTKKWYGIPASDSSKFEALMRSTAPDLFKRQPDLLHQLVSLLSPMQIVANNIKCYYANQNPNEFVITYPKVYHAGFNSGFNVNEAVNFTMEMWLEYGEASISDYKLIKKENVFNHFKLMENVLLNFSVGKESNIDLVRRCLSSYKQFIARTKMSLKALDKNFELEDLSNVISYENYLEEDNKDEVDEEELCDICQTHISHIFCVYNNRKHRFNEIAVEDSKTTKISINQLLTPESSPLEVRIAKFDRIQDKEHNVLESCDLLLDITSSSRSNLTNIKSEMNPGRNLRKSNRIIKPKKEVHSMKSKMSIINHSHSMNDLNSKIEIHLCLDCAKKFADVPTKSQLVVNITTEEMERFASSIEVLLP
ncbi:hypothetical protein PSN45_001329 [Yamadazyma tenuis]|uniref:JmjC-domain-containing protein n=1 Tax=Candida tenuis (strain ATCC 10573 / BCRC 21748 / CBS 615 / JCM 9827 / NBRC 10315 / NRRL Y-1498 / VKM Y-70) TaxID=590646 RepID=G3BCT5_CANTC|nr:JmjC-domain-containing protein [Yamadazyma tenuis ATCC 10573]EGV60880.1 JmjC-domain-containing protein [Yamadazyma tenuis ATCC 10573]WEJ93852.1 hypothetical protein PSN45_001329 [Yamadazyma tenuis]